MGIVYMIECLETGEKYVGSTKGLLHTRMIAHKSVKGDCCSKQIIDRNNYTSYIVEEVEEGGNLLKREQYHMDNTVCINKRNAYGFNNREERERQRQAKRYQENRETILEKAREKITCECGAIICRGSKSLHLKCKRHQNWVMSQNSSVS